VANSFEKMIVKNANTLAHGGVHLVVLAYSALFVKVKRLFSIAPEAKKRR
jgi:hypothetical protein